MGGDEKTGVNNGDQGAKYCIEQRRRGDGCHQEAKN